MKLMASFAEQLETERVEGRDAGTWKSSLTAGRWIVTNVHEGKSKNSILFWRQTHVSEIMYGPC